MANDLTRGSPMRVLLAFSLPLLAGNLIQQFYNMVDLVIVGRFVGVGALAAVGATGSTMFFVFSLVAGLTTGASVVISQYYGGGDRQKTRSAVATAIVVLLAATALLTVLGSLIVRPVLTLMGTPAEILEGAVAYLRIIFLGIAATVAYNGAASILRALGDSLTPLIFLAVAAVSNIFLDLLFIVGFGMGVAGAAWATLLAQALSAVACIVYALKKMPILRLTRADFAPDRVILAQTIKLGVPTGIQNSLLALGSMAVQSVVNTFGAGVVAAYAGAAKLDQVAVQPMLALAMGTATFTAQNMGAGRVDRVRRGFWSGIAMMAGFCAVVTPLLFFGGRFMMTLFVGGAEAEVLEIGSQYLRLVSLFYIVAGIVIQLENTLRGAGDVIIPTLSNAVEIIVRILAAHLLAASFGYRGVWWAPPLSWVVGTVICAVRYGSGRWQYKALVSRDRDAGDTQPE